MTVFKLASATITVDGKEVGLWQYMVPLPKADAPVANPSRFIEVTVTLTISGPFQYKRRELQLNLGRYMRWPYTN